MNNDETVAIIGLEEEETPEHDFLLGDLVCLRAEIGPEIMVITSLSPEWEDGKVECLYFHDDNSHEHIYLHPSLLRLY